MENLISIQAPKGTQNNYESKTLRFLRTGFDLFTLGGKQRVVVQIKPNMQGQLDAPYNVSTSKMGRMDYVKSAVKVIAMFTIIVPLIAFAMTKAYRSQVHLYNLNPSYSSKMPNPHVGKLY